MPTVFLDTQFRVRRFTPAMSRLLQLIPSDVGRPIVDMSQENLGPDLIIDAQEVLDHLAPVKKEIRINDVWYVRAALPYRTSDNRIEGVVITYNDVSDLKRAEERTRHLASFPQLNPSPVCEVDASGSVTFCNPATERILESLGMDNRDVGVFVPHDLPSILADWDRKSDASHYRELAIKDRVFGVNIYLNPHFNVARIYAFDITERKRAEEALRGSEARLRLFIEHAPAALAMFDTEMRYLSVSRRWLSDYGLGGNNPVGKSHYDIFPEMTAEWREAHRRGLAGEVLRAEADRFDRADGSVQWVRWEIRPWHTAAGEVGGIVIFAEDITERKKAEEALRESETQFRTLADSIPNLAWWANADGYITWYNRRWYEYTGTTPEEMEGWGWQSVHDPEVLPRVLERWKASIDTGEPFDMEFPLRGADGIFRPFLTRVMPLKDSAGRVFRWFGTNTDITELKKAEEAQGRLAAIVESSEDAIISKDLDGIIQSWNVGAEKIFGYAADEVMGKNISLLIPPGHSDEVPEILARIKGGEHIENFETARIRKDGTIVPVSLNFSAIKDARGKVIGASKIAHDISERKKAEEEIRRRVEDLRSANEELARFNSVAVGRELQMVELKKEVNELCGKTGEPPRYRIVFAEEG
jgi:PAS domain S-box-containing protein